VADRDSSRPRRWHVVEGDPHEAIVSNVARLLRQDSTRSKLAKWRRLRLDEPEGDGEHRWMGLSPGRRARRNLIRNAIEAQVADHAKDLPAPQLSPVGADYKLTRKVLGLQRVLDGTLDWLGWDELVEEQIDDSCTYGTGIIRRRTDVDRIVLERVYPGDYLTEPREEAAGKIRTVYQITAVDRDVLEEKFPKKAHEIQLAKPARDLLGELCEDDDALVLVIEAWRIRNTRDKDSHGRYTVCIDGATLEDDTKWDSERFPFSLISYSRDPESKTWGRGLPERMCGQQYEQNSLREVISDNARLLAGAKVIAYQGADITEDQWTNASGELIRVTGSPGCVQAMTVSGNAPDLIMYADRQWADSMADQGIDPMSVSGQIPDQVDSGKAQQVYRDNRANRHAMLGRQVERGVKQIGWLVIQGFEEIVDAGHKPVVRAKGRRRGTIDSVNYNDVRVSTEHFEITIQPISDFAKNPAQKYAQAMEMYTAGIIDGAQFTKLYRLPDNDSLLDELIAGRDLADQLIDAALDIDASGYEKAANDRQLPVSERACDREYLIKRGWRQHASMRLAKATNEDLQALRDLIGSAQTQLEQEAEEAAKKAAAAMPPAGPPPPGMPMTPPAVPAQPQASSAGPPLSVAV